MNTGDSDSTLKELKRLLLSDEVEQLARLSRRLDDMGIRAEELADVLPRALRLHQADPADLINALEAPVTECVTRSVSRDPNRFADALFPVMGPAIRRAIAEALKGLVESINQAMEHSVSAKGIAWRIEAARTGAPFAEVVLRHTLAYRVEQAFLIHPTSGLLMAHVADPQAVSQDPDAVSGMLTAIESFVNDAFSSGDGDDLDTVDVGDRKVWLIHGPYAVMACVIRGTPPVALRKELTQLSEDIHLAKGQALREFTGDRADLDNVDGDLSRCLVSVKKASDDQGKKPKGVMSPALIVMMVLLIGMLLWWGFSSWQDHAETQRKQQAEIYLTTTLRAQPGIMLADVAWQDGVLQLQGLRDPAAALPPDLVAKSGLNPDEVSISWRSYYDLAPAFVLARAQQIFQPPAGVSMQVSEQGVLQLQGVADPDWLTRVREQAPLVAGIRAVDDSALMDADSALLAAIRVRVTVPNGAHLAVKHQVLTVSGVAPLAWSQALPEVLGDVPQLQGITSTQLQIAEVLEAEASMMVLNTTRYAFISGASFDDAVMADLSATADSLRRLLTLSEQLHRTLTVQVFGRTDATGSRTLNRALAQKRAQVFVGAMLARGIPGSLFSIENPGSQEPSRGADPSMRRVDITVSMTAAPDAPKR